MGSGGYLDGHRDECQLRLALLGPLLIDQLQSDGTLVTLVPTVDDAVGAVTARLGQHA